MHSEGSGKGGNTFGLDVRFPVFCFSVSSVLSHMAFPISLLSTLSLSLSQLVTLRPLRPHHHHLAIATTLSHSHTQQPPLALLLNPVLSFSIFAFHCLWSHSLFLILLGIWLWLLVSPPCESDFLHGRRDGKRWRA